MVQSHTSLIFRRVESSQVKTSPTRRFKTVLSGLHLPSCYERILYSLFFCLLSFPFLFKAKRSQGSKSGADSIPNQCKHNCCSTTWPQKVTTLFQLVRPSDDWHHTLPPQFEYLDVKDTNRSSIIKLYGKNEKPIKVFLWLTNLIGASNELKSPDYIFWWAPHTWLGPRTAESEKGYPGRKEAKRWDEYIEK